MVGGKERGGECVCVWGGGGGGREMCNNALKPDWFIDWHGVYVCSDAWPRATLTTETNYTRWYS